MEDSRKDKIKTAIAAGIVLLLILTAIAISIKYSVEGEKSMPFKLSKIVIGSMVVSEDNGISIENKENGIIQNNGIYIEIKKNENYKETAVIDEIEISNIQITKQPQKGEVKIYIPNTTENKKFTYSSEYILEENSLKYIGANKSNTTTLEINNQGGIIAIAFGNTNLGTYNLYNQEVIIDGTMLKNMGITDEEIKFGVKFDLIINTKGKKFKTNINLDLPTTEITTTGKSTLEITDTSEYVFKREKN